MSSWCLQRQVVGTGWRCQDQRKHHRCTLPVTFRAPSGPRQQTQESTSRTAATADSAAQAPAVPDRSDGKHFWRVVLPTGLTMLLCNMDRICMSIAIMPMAEQFGWSPSVQGHVQAAFLWGYMMTQLVGGTLADRFGGKAVIGQAIKVFSLASLALPLLLRMVPRTAQAALWCVIAARFFGARPLKRIVTSCACARPVATHRQLVALPMAAYTVHSREVIRTATATPGMCMQWVLAKVWCCRQ